MPAMSRAVTPGQGADEYTQISPKGCGRNCEMKKIKYWKDPHPRFVQWEGRGPENSQRAL